MKPDKKLLLDLLKQRAIAHHMLAKPDQSAPYWRGYLDAIDLGIWFGVGIKQDEIQHLTEWKEIKSQGQLF